MNNEDLNQRLYERARGEQEIFRDWLLSLPKEEILNHAYQYATRQDILFELEEGTRSDKECRALLKQPEILSLLYHDWCDLETDYMDNIRDSIEGSAQYLIMRERKAAERSER